MKFLILIVSVYFSSLNVLADPYQDDIRLLKELVDVGSDTSEVSAVDECQDKVADRLKQMGFSVRTIRQPLSDVKTGSLLIGELKGTKPRFITLLMHTDTVFPKSSGFSGFRQDGDRAVGPGVIDDKGGVVVALRALASFLKSGKPLNYSLRVVVSPAEEIGSTGFLDLFAELSQDTDFLLGFEPALENGSIVSARRGDRWYDVRIEGIEAHAGRNHKKGANACHELAIKIEKLQKLTDYSKDVSINIGHMEGGKDKYAIVCGDAHAKLDVRFSDPKNRDAILKKVEVILNTTFVKSYDGKSPTKTTYKIVDDPKPFPLEKNALPIVLKHLSFIEKHEGKKTGHERSGGTADSNFFYRPGMVIIDGLGPVGGNMHRNDEFILLPSIGTRSKAVADLIDLLQTQ